MIVLTYWNTIQLDRVSQSLIIHILMSIEIVIICQLCIAMLN